MSVFNLHPRPSGTCPTCNTLANSSLTTRTMVYGPPITSIKLYCVGCVRWFDYTERLQAKNFFGKTGGILYGRYLYWCQRFKSFLAYYGG